MRHSPIPSMTRWPLDAEGRKKRAERDLDFGHALVLCGCPTTPALIQIIDVARKHLHQAEADLELRAEAKRWKEYRCDD